MLYVAYAAAWIGTAIAVAFGIKYTGSAWCLWALIIPTLFQVEDNEEGREEIHQALENKIIELKEELEEQCNNGK